MNFNDYMEIIAILNFFIENNQILENNCKSTIASIESKFTKSKEKE